jgi:hypothetical protein
MIWWMIGVGLVAVAIVLVQIARQGVPMEDEE